ncbi:peptidoglycan-binding protein [Bacillus daqingensis]|uniref:Peptidoglycan-binding protein n=1 Tax=Bacillus daqingensis TaxID=872396 RepID=A0ABV9NZQ1_9BACI
MKSVGAVVLIVIGMLVLLQTAVAAEAFLDPDIPVDSGQMVEVIVDLTEEPVHIQEKEAEESGEMFSALETEARQQEASALFEAYLEQEEVPVEHIEKLEKVLYGFALTIPAREAAPIAELDYVDGVYLSQLYEVTLETDVDSQEQTEALEVEMEALAELGLTGKGVKVGVLDSGIDYHHPSLQHAYRGGANFIRDGRTDPLEGHGVNSTHGTAVSAVIAGKGDVQGIAPDVDLYVYRVLNTINQGYTGSILTAMDQAVEDGVDVVNMSFGQESNIADTPLTKAISNMVDAGIVVVAAAGNDGEKGVRTINNPGTSPLALTIGASYLSRGQEVVADFSSRGPLTDTYDIKPDLTAPGAAIYTALSKSSAGGNYAKAYSFFSGTSFASPYTAGLAALLLEQDASLAPDEIKARIMNTADAINGVSVNDAGAGRIDPAGALQANVTAFVQDSHTFTEEGKEKQRAHRNGSLNLKAIRAGGTFSRTAVVTLENASASSVTYQTGVEEKAMRGMKMSLPKEVTVPAGGKKEVIVTLASVKPTAGYMEGWLTFRSNTAEDLRIPFGGQVETISNPVKEFKTDRNLVSRHVQPELQWNIDSSMKAELSLFTKDGTKLGTINPGSGTKLKWDLRYTDTNGAAKRAGTGTYQLKLEAVSGQNRYSRTLNIEVYEEKPTITLEATQLDQNLIRGKIASRFSDRQEADTAMTLTFELSQNGSRYSSGTASVQADGSFRIRNRLQDGESELTLTAEDRLGNKQTRSFTVVKEQEVYQLNDSGSGVEALQDAMKHLGFDPGESGTFGAGTQASLEKLQAYYGLEVTGEADTDTIHLIASITDGTYATPSDTEEVRTFKQRLTHLGFGTFPERPSPRYGPVTEGVVADFQQYYGLVVNGYGDPVTLRKMDELWGQSLKDGDDNENVRSMKMNLTSLGFGTFPERPSPRYGPVTEGVVRAFQEANGLRASGTANPITLAAIEEQLSFFWTDGDDDPAITGLKQQLTALGYGSFPQRPSTRYGPVTTLVVEDFQRDQGLSVTGNIDRVTEQTMNRLQEIVFTDGADTPGVRDVKQQLTSLGFGSFPQRPSTRYGPVTMSVVRDFQAHFGLEQSGNITRRDQQVLDRETATVLQSGFSTAEARDMKVKLSAAGYGTFPTEPSDVFGPVTASVVSDFQASQGLPISGIMDSVSLERLRELQ